MLVRREKKILGVFGGKTGSYTDDAEWARFKGIGEHHQKLTCSEQEEDQGKKKPEKVD